MSGNLDFPAVAHDGPRVIPAGSIAGGGATRVSGSKLPVATDMEAVLQQWASLFFRQAGALSAGDAELTGASSGLAPRAADRATTCSPDPSTVSDSTGKDGFPYDTRTVHVRRVQSALSNLRAPSDGRMNKAYAGTKVVAPHTKASSGAFEHSAGKDKDSTKPAPWTHPGAVTHDVQKVGIEVLSELRMLPRTPAAPAEDTRAVWPDPNFGSRSMQAAPGGNSGDHIAPQIDAEAGATSSAERSLEAQTPVPAWCADPASKVTEDTELQPFSPVVAGRIPTDNAVSTSPDPKHLPEIQTASGISSTPPPVDSKETIATPIEARLEPSASHNPTNRAAISANEPRIQTRRDGHREVFQLAPISIQPVPPHPSGEPGTRRDAGDLSMREVFTAIDSAEPGGTDAAITWVHSNNHSAEAGFKDPALGWISVRAHVGEGGVHASLVPGSTSAAEVLAVHLPGLNAHLLTDHPRMSPVTLSSVESGTANSALGGDPQQQYGSGTRNGGDERPPEGPAPAAHLNKIREFSGDSITEQILLSDVPTFSPALSPAGQHISVTV